MDKLTIEEAIKQLEFDMAMILFDPSTGEKWTPEQIKWRNNDNYRTYLADQMAIEALKKQIPMKPVDQSKVKDGEKYVGLIGRCPSCGDIVDATNLICEECLQKLDWSV